MNDRVRNSAAVDYDTQMPIIHPQGTIETRPAVKGEIGHSRHLGDTAITAVSLLINKRAKAIGDTDQAGYPTTLSSPYDLDVHGKPFEQNATR